MLHSPEHRIRRRMLSSYRKYVSHALAATSTARTRVRRYANPKRSAGISASHGAATKIAITQKSCVAP